MSLEGLRVVDILYLTTTNRPAAQGKATVFSPQKAALYDGHNMKVLT